MEPEPMTKPVEPETCRESYLLVETATPDITEMLRQIAALRMPPEMLVLSDHFPGKIITLIHEAYRYAYMREMGEIGEC